MRRVALVVLVLSAALLVAACGGGGQTTAPGGDQAPAGGGAMLSVTGTDGLMFEPDRLSASAGEATVELTAQEGVRHTFAVEGVKGGEPIVEAQPGQTATGSVQLEPGTYTFFCDVPGHREAGMEGTLTVK